MTPLSTNYRYAPQFQNAGNGKGMAQNDRQLSQWQGDVLNAEISGDVDRQNDRANMYRNWADDQYRTLLNGQGGYTQAEKDMIWRDDELSNLALKPWEEEQNYLTQGEQDAIRGDAWHQAKYYAPDQDWALANEGAGFQRGAVDDMQSRLDTSAGRAGLEVRGNLPGELVLNAENTASKMRSSFDPSRTEVSDSFLQDYRMSPEEQQAIVTSAGMDVRNRNLAQMDALGRKAANSGVNPLGVAALQQRAGRQAAIDAADAMTRARVGAGAEAANRLRIGEDMRVGYGQSAASMRAGNELAAGQMWNDANVTGEQMRLSSERDIRDRMRDAAVTGGNTRLANEQAITQQKLNVSGAQQDRGIDVARYADQQNAERNRAIALNRQATTQANTADRYNRNANIYNQRSGVNANFADARRQDQAEGRGYLQNQNAQANQNAQQGWNRRVDVYGTQAGARNAATGNQIRAEGTPGKWERFGAGLLNAGAAVAGAALMGGSKGGGATGGIITRPTHMILGEDGPEAVVPLNGREDARVAPTVAAPAFDTDPMMRQPKPYSMRYRYASAVA